MEPTKTNNGQCESGTGATAGLEFPEGVQPQLESGLKNQWASNKSLISRTKSGGFANSAAYKIRVDHQLKDRKSAWSDHPAAVARPRH